MSDSLIAMALEMEIDAASVVTKTMEFAVAINPPKPRGRPTKPHAALIAAIETADMLVLAHAHALLRDESTRERATIRLQWMAPARFVLFANRHNDKHGTLPCGLKGHEDCDRVKRKFLRFLNVERLCEI